MGGGEPSSCHVMGPRSRSADALPVRTIGDSGGTHATVPQGYSGVLTAAGQRRARYYLHRGERGDAQVRIGLREDRHEEPDAHLHENEEKGTTRRRMVISLPA